MANGDASFPIIPAGSWWKLRDLFKKKVPAAVTPTYIATALSMAESSAQTNLIGPFKKIGILEDGGKPTDLAYDWRDDSKYASVCETLLTKHYPQEVRDLFHSPDVDQKKLINWFMSRSRCGQVTGRMYASFYLLLLKADPKANENASAKNGSETRKPTAPKSKPRAKSSQKKDISEVAAPQMPVSTQPVPAVATSVLGNAPELHINIQLHISPESSTEQIDKIFESMAKHLKDFNR